MALWKSISDGPERGRLISPGEAFTVLLSLQYLFSILTTKKRDSDTYIDDGWYCGWNRACSFAADCGHPLVEGLFKTGENIGTSGMCNTKTRPKEEPFILLEWAHVLKDQGNLLALVDIRIGSDYNIDELMTMINVALLCTNPTASARPPMSSVVSMLEGKASVKEFFIDSSVSSIHRMNAEVMKKIYGKLEEDDPDISQTKSMLANGAWTGSTSAADLYPVSLTSAYWQSRDSTN
ncbi:hypothetical protein V6N11_052089 [Hibiscus sabdariffa]|uniref:Uncharacterized protein n=1 Tax=Hibiscus sabdariffa TaxID=183260 RepID=A0ABR2U9Q9_9ROSI